MVLRGGGIAPGVMGYGFVAAPGKWEDGGAKEVDLAERFVNE